jgi:diaminohydroxyphosphoribosylaminopyrimidine deaminase / 5-amino-6-(5-phosphoribosylamino)uracil reductase
LGSNSQPERLSPIEAMRLALNEAKKGWGYTRPNPNVGCVILSADGILLASGYHKKIGEAHAEIDALNNLSDKSSLRDATVFVTLEPCAHTGRTGACAVALSQLPVREIVYGLVDPNPLVSGRGLEILRSAGKKVSALREVAAHAPELPDLERELEAVAEHFLFNQRMKSPFVALKVATTLDGIMAHTSGESKWITGEAARTEVHRLRARFAAMLIGKNTFLRDNPYLNIRHPEFHDKSNKVIVLDSSGSGLLKLRASNLYKSHAPADIFWVVDESFENKSLVEELGINIVFAPIATALPQFFAAGIDSIMVEGGAQVLSYFIEHRLAQRMYHFIAPQIAGAQNGVAWTAQVKLNWDSRVRLKETSVTHFGEDLLLTGKF